VTDKRGRGVSEPGRADQPGPAAGEREERPNIDRRAGIRSVQLKSKPPDLGRTPEIQRPGLDLNAVAPLGPTTWARWRRGGGHGEALVA
jgi:hypothetical protein